MNRNILDVGCGNNKVNGAIGMDMDKNSDADVIHDLNKFPFPFKDNTFDTIYCNHCLEHLFDTIKVLNELYRIAKPFAGIVIRVPHSSGNAAWGNPTHVKAFGLGMIKYIESNMPFIIESVKLHYLDYNNKKSVLRPLAFVLDFLANLNRRFCERFWIYYFGGFNEMEMKLVVMKEQGKCDTNV